MNFEEKRKLIHLVIRVPKEHSHFAYFILEANEGLCFYSTLDESIGPGTRDIDILGSTDFQDEILRIISKLQEKYPVEIITHEAVYDPS